MEKALSIVKPDAVAAGVQGHIIQAYLDAGFQIQAMKMTRLTVEQAKSFYAVHVDRPFFDDLVTFMTEGPIVVSILAAENAVKKHRELIGNTDSTKAEEGTLRARFGTDIERNAVHGSDSVENGIIETNFFFSQTERTESK